MVVLELEFKLLFWLGGALPLSCIPNIKTFSDGKDTLKYCCVLSCVWVNTIMRNYWTILKEIVFKKKSVNKMEALLGMVVEVLGEAKLQKKVFSV